MPAFSRILTLSKGVNSVYAHGFMRGDSLGGTLPLQLEKYHGW